MRLFTRKEHLDYLSFVVSYLFVVFTGQLLMTLKEYNFIYLLAGLLFLLLVIPLVRDLTGTIFLHISELAYIVFIIIGIWSLKGPRHWFFLGIILAVLGVSGNLLALADAGTFFVYLSLCSYIAFLLLTISLAIQQAINLRTVDANNIIGAICIYLLLGVMWSFFYVLVNILLPGSFNISISGSPFEQAQDFLYYSFVTLTTLGYGDITPIRDTARALSVIEAILGQFYIAILVAGLVASFITRKKLSNGN